MHLQITTNGFRMLKKKKKKKNLRLNSFGSGRLALLAQTSHMANNLTARTPQRATRNTGYIAATTLVSVDYGSLKAFRPD
jgi:hypothetical protein